MYSGIGTLKRRTMMSTFVTTDEVAIACTTIQANVRRPIESARGVT